MNRAAGIMLVGALVLSGCRGVDRRCPPGGVAPTFPRPGDPAPLVPGGPPGAVVPGPVPPGPPAPVPPGPPGGAFVPGPPAPVPPGAFAPPPGSTPIPPSFPSHFGPPPGHCEYRWQPGLPPGWTLPPSAPATPGVPPTSGLPPTTGVPPRVDVFLAPPEPIVDESRKPGTPEPPLAKKGPEPKLLPPEPLDKTAEKPAEKPAPKPPASLPGLPVGIPHFAMVQEKVSCGLRPSEEGLAWLAGQGYKTVLLLYAPGDDVAADRQQTEKASLKFLSLEVSAIGLTRDLVERFNRIVSESGPGLFVGDKDGTLGGSMWYLHFRTAEQLPDDAARIRARSLGLRDDGEGQHRLMWFAVQKYLSESR